MRKKGMLMAIVTDNFAAYARMAQTKDYKPNGSASDDIQKAYENLANAIIVDAAQEYLRKRQTLVTLDRTGGWKADERYLSTLIDEARRLGYQTHKGGIKDGIIVRTLRAECGTLESWLFCGGCEWLNPGIDMDVIRAAVDRKVEEFRKDQGNFAFSLRDDGRGHHINRVTKPKKGEA